MRSHAGSRGLLVVAVVLAQVRLVGPAGAVGVDAQVDQVAITIDTTNTHQTMQGFGALASALAFADTDELSPDQRVRMLDAAFNQAHLTMTTTGSLVVVTPDNNSDPFNINWPAYNAAGLNLIKTKEIDPAMPLGLSDLVVGPILNTRFASQWLRDLRGTDYNRYVNQAAKLILANALYWQNQYGITPQFIAPFDEPLGGTGLLANGSARDLVDITRRGGELLRQAGFTSTKFVLTSDETVDKSLSEAQLILADADAAQYVAAVSYHIYPYGALYSSVPKILATSGRGVPDATQLAVRAQIRDLAEQNHSQLWMTEVSHGDVDALGYDDFRGRAIHIHDELVYADASAYFAISAMWDTDRQKYGHNPNATIHDQDGTVALLDKNTDTVYIGGVGRAIGHYARWIHKGSVRIDASSSDPLVQVTGFRDDNQGQLVLVAINNSDADRALSVNVNGAGISGPINGELTSQQAYWQPIDPLTSADGASFSMTVPRFGVITVSWPM